MTRRSDCLRPLDFALDADSSFDNPDSSFDNPDSSFDHHIVLDEYELQVPLRWGPWVVFSSPEKAMEYGKNILGCRGYVEVPQPWGCETVFRPCQDTAGLERVLAYEALKRKLCLAFPTTIGPAICEDVTMTARPYFHY